MGDRFSDHWRLMAIVICLLAGGEGALAFHEGGVASCGGCHVMHDGVAGALLIADSPSDLCLSCHAERLGEVLGLDPLAPPPERGGGNFVFLLEDNINDGPDGATNPIPGDAAGHNVVAPGHGLAADRRNSFAPGGTFPADRLGCTSCHDPHGRDTFRLLLGAGPVQDDLAQFSFPAPDADGIEIEGAPESPNNHTAYRAGMSDWCGNCHGRFHDEGDPDFEHPSDENLDSDIVLQYNRYNGDEDPTGGFFATAYLPEVPFEDPSSTITGRTGTSSISRVMCLSCHRAHATSAPFAGRWDFNVSLLAADGLPSGSYPIPDPYASPNQGPLCTKCHEGGAPD
jgi:predicted CXXCH cytochrome family protein